jgi:hypothetical protein
MERTKELRSPDCKKLLISYRKPHKAVSRETISRWCKTVLRLAGINTKEFGCHSTRVASTSHVASKVGDITQIIESEAGQMQQLFKLFITNLSILLIYIYSFLSFCVFL